MGFSGAQTEKNLTAKWETWVRSLGWEDPLEEGMAIHSSILARRNPMDREAWGLKELDTAETTWHKVQSWGKLS